MLLLRRCPALTSRGSHGVLATSALHVSRASLHSDGAASSSSSTHHSTTDGGSPFEQFSSQQQKFYSHSFHEKGSTHTSSSSSSSSESQEQRHDGKESSHGEQEGERVAGRGSATAQERRHLSRHWENAFFGRVHFETGMHDRYAAAVAADDMEDFENGDDERAHAGDAAGGTQRPSEEDMYANARKANRELFPDWPEDEDAPRLAFHKLPDALKAQYIINRLTMGERRVRYAVDYGSLSMMAQLNLGESMLYEAEALLNELGWMNDVLRRQIEAVKADAYKTKYDYDLD